MNASNEKDSNTEFKTETISTEFHSLFIKEESVDLESIKLSIDGVEMPLNSNSTIINTDSLPKRKKYTLYISDFEHNGNQLHPILNGLREANPEDVLEVRINSGGGYIDEGITLYNIMRDKFANRAITILDNYAASMGGFLFSMGNDRLAYEYSSLMYHDYSSGIGGKGDNMKTQFEHTNETLHNFLFDLLVKNKFLSKKEFDEMVMGKDFWFSSEELAKRNIATHISVDGYILPSKDYLNYKASKLSIDKFISDLLNKPENKKKLKEKK